LAEKVIGLEVEAYQGRSTGNNPENQIIFCGRAVGFYRKGWHVRQLAEIAQCGRRSPVARIYWHFQDTDPSWSRFAGARQYASAATQEAKPAPMSPDLGASRDLLVQIFQRAAAIRSATGSARFLVPQM